MFMNWILHVLLGIYTSSDNELMDKKLEKLSARKLKTSFVWFKALIMDSSMFIDSIKTSVNSHINVYVISV